MNFVFHISLKVSDNSTSLNHLQVLPQTLPNDIDKWPLGIFPEKTGPKLNDRKAKSCWFRVGDELVVFHVHGIIRFLDNTTGPVKNARFII